jgi:hypothetical protein
MKIVGVITTGYPPGDELYCNSNKYANFDVL